MAAINLSAMRPPLPIRLALLALVLTLLPAAPARAETVHVAVAANFTRPAEFLAEAFTAASGHEVLLTTGSTGLLYAQIVHGAPFDVFLAADRARPARLVVEGHAVAGSARTYATGRLALWDPQASAGDPMDRLRSGRFRRLALANPELAPYGAAAQQVLGRLGLADTAAGRLVHGENIAQTHAFVATGNADLGLVALAQLTGNEASGRFTIIPAAWHDPIRQDAVLLARGGDNAAARAWLDFLASPRARDIIEGFGYEVPR